MKKETIKAINRAISDLEDDLSNASRAIGTIEAVLNNEEEESDNVRLALAFMCRKEQDDDNFNRMEVDREVYKKAVSIANNYTQQMTSVEIATLLRKLGC